MPPPSPKPQSPVPSHPPAIAPSPRNLANTIPPIIVHQRAWVDWIVRPMLEAFHQMVDFHPSIWRNALETNYMDTQLT